MKGRYKVIIPILALSMVVILTSCNKQNNTNGFFETSEGTGVVSKDTNNNDKQDTSGTIGGKVSINNTVDDKNTQKENNENNDNITDTENNKSNKNQETEQEEKHVDTVIVEQPMPTWSTDDSYAISELKKIDTEDENKKDQYYIDDKLYITITNNKVTYQDIDVEYTYTYGSLQPADLDAKETDKIVNCVLYLTESRSYNDLVSLQKEIDALSSDFKVEIKTITANVESWIPDGIPESEEVSNIQE